jgi:amino acid adenylation domain-containing protein
MDLSQLSTPETLPPSPPPADDHEVYLFPTSFAQRRLWLLSQMEGQANVYHLFSAFSLRGPLRILALRQALGKVVARHEALRTRFMILDGEPVQVVSPQSPDLFTVADLSRLLPGGREVEARRAFRELVDRPFDLVRGPLLRVLLIRFGEGEHELCYVLHHIVGDALSEAILIHEVTALYEAVAAGDASSLSDLPLQYGDYAQWQRETLQSETLEELLAYWRGEIASAPLVLSLPTDRPRPSSFTYRGAVVGDLWPSALSQSLTTLARGEGVTSFMVLLAGLGLLLSRAAGQDQVLIGFPIANRGQVELEGVIGLFLDTVVLRVDLRGDPSFLEILSRVREALQRAWEHQDLPFERLVSAFAQRDPSRSPIFQVWLNQEPAPPEIVTFGGLELAPVPLNNPTVKFDLMLDVRDVGRRISAAFTYNVDLFDPATVRRWLGDLQALLERAAENPERRVSGLVLPRESERHQLLAEWNDTVRPPAPPSCLHALLGERVALSGAEVAVVTGGRCLTFRELDLRAERLADRLHRLGVRPDVPVAVLMRRSLELLPALLGILKAGGAYVPIDPAYPAERIAFVLEDCGCRIVLTQSDLSGLLAREGVEILCLDGEEEQEEPAAPAERPGRALPAEESLAYVIYTSGSTGRPKGVMVPHRGAVAYLRWCLESYGIAEGNGAPVHSSLGFDLSLTALLAPLAAGRPVYLLPEGEGVEPLATALRTAPEFSFTKLTPAHLDLINRSLPATVLPATTKALILGGEALAARSLAVWREQAPDIRLINEYGPTETVVGCCVHEVSESDPATGEVPIGRPIARTRIYLLDEQGLPVPSGSVGEVCVGGDQVSRGYLRRPGLTAERFVPDAWSGEPGGRLYRTGDLARYGADGRLRLLGRCDGQVKIQGYRIEPGEVEAVLLEHPGIREAVVAAWGEAGDKRLAAWVVPASDEAPSAEDLRQFLLIQLPEYMVPRFFVPLTALPLTAHGKVDRAALPEPGVAQDRAAAPFVAPRDSVEETLAAIWTAVLTVDPVGIHDNFFVLGGDSIRSIRIVALARERGIRLTMQEVANYPTIAGLAAHLRASGGGQAEVVHTEPFSLISAGDRTRLPEGVEDAYPLSGLQAGMLYHIEELAGAPVFHSINSFHLRLPFDPEKFQRTVSHITARHANLRTAFDLTNYSEPLQFVYREPWFPLGWTDVRHLNADEQQQALQDYWDAEILRPFDLSRPPQLRFHVHWRTDETLQFTLTENHAVIDGWSLHTVFSEIFTCYSALLRGEELPELQPLSTTFRDFIYLERMALQSQDCQEFWTQKLEGCQVLRVPRRRARRDLPAGKRCLRLNEMLPPDLSTALRKLARTQALPLKSLFLAVHCRVMGFLTEMSEVVTGVSSNGRPETLDGQRVCGLFLNTLPLRVRLGEGTWKDLAQTVHAAQIEMLPYRRYPLSAIQARWGPERLLETSFVYLNFHVMEEAVQSRGLKAAGGGEFVEETNFVVMTAFTHNLGAPDEIIFNATSDLSVLDEEQARSLTRYYHAALRELVSHPDGNYLHVSLLSPEERTELLADFAGSRSPFPAVQGTLHGLFEAQVERTPDAPCVIVEGRSLKFRETDLRANRLAHRLRRLGIGPDRRVALLLDRSEFMIVGILGVLKAGGAYVPLDPSFPGERLRHLLRDAGAAAVVTRQDWLDRLPAGSPPVEVIDVEIAGDDISAEVAPVTGATEENLAYVLYTSGSTGTAKGVAVEHRQVLSYVSAITGRLDLPREGRFAHVSTFAADLGNTVLFPALCSGGTLYVASESQIADGNALVEDFAGERFDVLKIVPSQLSALLEHPDAARLLPRRLILGGEALAWTTFDGIRRLAPDCRIFNHYGPTEATVGVLAGEVDETARVRDVSKPPLGRPLDHARAYVLGEALSLVPVGTPGELFIGGPAVSRGYLGRPDLTAERFVPDSFSSSAGARLYRTGDRVRWLPGGELEFLGRTDHQVKIRGFRVELGEIEAILRRYPAVREAVAVARSEGGSDLSLSVYYVPRRGEEPAESDLRRFLAGHLPSYMIPAALVRLDELPLNANGKLDRQALPAQSTLQPQTAIEGPRDPTQVQLLHLWEEVLGHRSFGIRDDFFAAGGNSLFAVQLVAKIRRHFGQKLPLASLLETRTVESLARTLQAGAEATPVAHLIPIQPRGERRPLFCVHPGHGSVSSYLTLARYLGPEQPFFGLQAQDLDRDGDPYLSVEELAARYLAEVMALVPRGPYLLAGWSFGGLVAFEMAQQLRRRGEEVVGLALLDTRTPAVNERLVGIEPELMKSYLLLEQAKHLAKLSASELPLTPEDLVGLELEQQLDRILESLSLRARLPEEIDAATVRRYLELRLARFQAIKNYVPEPYEGRITLFRATDVYTDTALAEAAEIFAEAARNPTYGWNEIALSPLDLRPVPGDHETMIREPYVRDLATSLRGLLDEIATAGDLPAHRHLAEGLPEKRREEHHVY